MATRMVWVGALLALIIFVIGGTAQAGEEVMKDGVLHVQNSAEPRDGRRDVQLEEMWRVGGEDGEDFFGLISQLLVDEEGMIYLLDTRLSEVAVYSPDGERIETLSREGDGPGETRMPSDMLFMPDGSVGLVQIFPGKIVKIGKDGTPMGEFELARDKTEGGFIQFFDCHSAGGNIFVSGFEFHTDGTSRTDINFLSCCDENGEELVRIFERERYNDFTKFSWIEDDQDQVDFRKWIVGDDGRVYVAPDRNDYRINVYTADGQLERIVEREFQLRERSESEYNKIKEAREGAILRQLPDAKVEASRYHQTISGLRNGPDGNLWVETSRGSVDQPEGVFFTWDVFDPDGHFIEQVSAICDGDGESDMMLWTDQGVTIQVTGFIDAVEALQGGGQAADDDDDDEAAPMEVVCFKIAGT